MKHLIITGEQATGKTLLGNMLQFITDVIVHDEVTMSQILKLISNEDFFRRLPYSGYKTHVFITNDLVQYGELIRPEKFLIIRLSPVQTN